MFISIMNDRGGIIIFTRKKNIKSSNGKLENFRKQYKALILC